MKPRGPVPGRAKSHQRILDVMRALGTEKDGRPKAIRAAELAERAGIGHGNLGKVVDILVATGEITRCRIVQPRGAPTHEYRIAAGAKAPAFVPLNTARAGVARAAPSPGQPLRVSATRTPGDARDAALLERVQRMDAAEFGQFIGWLAQTWQWARQPGGVAA